MELRCAKEEERQQLIGLYRAAIGREGCTWSSDYPGEAEVSEDLAARCLYVAAVGQDLAGAVSVVPHNELDDLNCWEVHDGTQREIARIVIADAYLGQGRAAEMLRLLFAQLAAQGCRAIHLLVAEENMAARRTYEKLGFRYLEKCHRYGIDFYACEKMLGREENDALPAEKKA